MAITESRDSLAQNLRPARSHLAYPARRRIVSGFTGLVNDDVILAALTDIETDWHRGVAYVGMSRARTRLHVVIHEDCDGKRREREVEWEARGESDVEMLL